MTAVETPALTFDVIRTAALSLPNAERLRLHDLLTESLDETVIDAGDPPSAELLADLERIRKGVEDGTIRTYSEDEFRDWLRSRRS